MRRRQLLTALPVLAAILTSPQLVWADPLQHVTLKRLSALFHTVERWDLKVETVYVSREAFRRLVGQEGVDPLGPSSFLLWGARFVQHTLPDDQISLVGNSCRTPVAVQNFEYFHLTWPKPQHGQRHHWDDFDRVWRTDQA